MGNGFMSSMRGLLSVPLYLLILDQSVSVPNPSPLAEAYYRSGNILWLIDRLTSLLLPAGILFLGFSSRIRETFERRKLNPSLQPAAYFAAYASLFFLLDLPLQFYAGYVRERSYGLSQETISNWCTDTITGYLLLLLVGCSLIGVPFAIMKRSPRRWWLYTGLLSIPAMAIGMIVSPLWIDPLFNHFGPLKNQEIQMRIMAEARRAGIDDPQIFELSRRVETRRMTAYVTGLFGSGRIVVSDTMIAQLDERELQFVVGHELGHYALRHVYKGILVASVLVIAGLVGIHLISGLMLQAFGGLFGFRKISEPASLPLLLLLCNLFFLILTPIGNGYTRYQEREADRFGLELTQDNYAAASAFLKLIGHNLDYPWPGQFYRVMRSTHPATGERIEFCNSYHPWRSGMPLKYGAYFRESPVIEPR